MMSLLLPAGARRAGGPHAPQAAEKRAAEALLDGQLPAAAARTARRRDEIEIDATATMSAEERLKTLDFEQMSRRRGRRGQADAGAASSLPVQPLTTRRSSRRRRAAARIDARAHPARSAAPWRRDRQRCARKAPRHPLAEPGRPLRHLGLDGRLLAAWCCISSTPSPTARGRAGRRSTPSPSARG